MPIIRRLAVVLSTLVAASATAQETPRPMFRVGSELVVVDLVATDRAGKFVSNLQPADIQLHQDGKPQKVQFVQLVRAGQRVEGPAAPAAPTEASAGAASRPGPRKDDVLVAIVLDLGSMPSDAMPRVREAVLQLVRDEVPADTAVMLATIWPSIEIRQTFTRDRGSLVAAVERIPVSLGGHLSFVDMLAKLDQTCDTTAPTDPALALTHSAISFGKAVITETHQRLTAASNSLAALARSLGGVPGRKHIVLYSAGYMLNPANDVVEALSTGIGACLGAEAQTFRRRIGQELGITQSMDSTLVIQTAIDRANRGQVSFYAVDPRGLVPTNVQAQHRTSARMARSGMLQKMAARDETLTQEYLHSLAMNTGGRAYLNSNDIGQGLRRALLDANEYYLIGYSPDGPRRKGQFRTIQVKVNRPVLDLRYRQGYYDAADQDVARSDIESAFREPAAFQRDGFDVETSVGGGKMKVTAFIPPASITFTPTGEVFKAEFSLHATLRDDKGKLIGGKPLLGRDVTLRLDGDKLGSLLTSDNIEVPTEVSSPPAGKYQLTFVARDSAGWIATSVKEITVDR